MAKTKAEILKVLDNISGPIESSVMRDIVESIIDFVEEETLGAEIKNVEVEQAGDIIDGDLEFSADSVGVILIDRTTAARKRITIDNDVLGSETVT
jgi:hypothetical protein